MAFRGTSLSLELRLWASEITTYYRNKNIGADPKKKNINEVISDSYHPGSGEIM